MELINYQMIVQRFVINEITNKNFFEPASSNKYLSSKLSHKILADSWNW